LDPVDILRVIEREGIRFIVVVGDAFIRPIIDELRTGRYDASSLRIISTGGAAMTAGTKAEILELLPKVTIVDTVGSSESGAQGRMVTSAGGSPVAGRFEAAADSTVLTADLDGRLAAGSDVIGWFARRGRIPLGYLDDPDATRRTFPTVEGVRWSVPGDRARLLADGSIELLGRDSVTVNTGGEKVFVEEVEQILVAEPEVYDVLVERVLRSPSGKADYRWAAALVSGETPPGE
jgi:fatty-acyl-CoA synthase